MQSGSQFLRSLWPLHLLKRGRRILRAFINIQMRRTWEELSGVPAAGGRVSANWCNLCCFLRVQDVKTTATATIQAELDLGTGCDHTSLSPACPSLESGGRFLLKWCLAGTEGRAASRPLLEAQGRWSRAEDLSLSLQTPLLNFRHCGSSPFLLQ